MNYRYSSQIIMSCTLLHRQPNSIDFCKGLFLHVIRVCFIVPCVYKFYEGGGGGKVGGEGGGGVGRQ